MDAIFFSVFNFVYKVKGKFCKMSNFLSSWIWPSMRKSDKKCEREEKCKKTVVAIEGGFFFSRRVRSYASAVSQWENPTSLIFFSFRKRSWWLVLLIQVSRVEREFEPLHNILLWGLAFKSVENQIKEPYLKKKIRIIYYVFLCSNKPLVR